MFDRCHHFEPTHNKIVLNSCNHEHFPQVFQASEGILGATVDPRVNAQKGLVNSKAEQVAQIQPARLTLTAEALAQRH